MDHGDSGSGRSFKRRRRNDSCASPSKPSCDTSNKNSSHPEVVDLTKDDAIIVIDATNETFEISCSLESSNRRSSSSTSSSATTTHEVITLLDSPKSVSPKPTPRFRRTNTLPHPQAPDSPPNALKCPICLETCADIKKRGPKIVVTRCGHIFCDLCLKKALNENGRKCPKCRKNVPKGVTGFIEVFDVC